ncbi:hypothetical protein WKU26_05935 [Phocaeicola sp. HCN-40430]|uniref:hypothetical protein n=1 Tax=Phocaeicola sp. HCN-40430 TaxID=3134664 RepID=UPI0030BBE903
MKAHILQNTAKQLLLDLLKNDVLLTDQDVMDRMEEIVNTHKRKECVHPLNFSPVVIDDDCNIVFPEFSDTPLKMQYLWKTIYIFLLLKKDGVNFNKLSFYKDDLYQIYQFVSREKNVDARKINKTLERLALKGSNVPHEICSRIRSILRKVVPKDVFPYYDIMVKRGGVHFVHLDRSLLIVNNEKLSEFRD